MSGQDYQEPHLCEVWKKALFVHPCRIIMPPYAVNRTSQQRVHIGVHRWTTRFASYCPNPIWLREPFACMAERDRDSIRRLGPVRYNGLDGLRSVDIGDLPARAFPLQTDVLHLVVIAVDVLHPRPGFIGIGPVG